MGFSLKAKQNMLNKELKDRFRRLSQLHEQAGLLLDIEGLIASNPVVKLQTAEC